MVVLVGLLVLCCIFTFLGSKEEEASVLYYDMEGSDEGAAVVEDGDVAAPSKRRSPEPPSQEVGEGRLADDRPAEMVDSDSAAAMASQIYQDIDL